MDQFRIDVSAEWYAAVSRFNVLEPGTFTGQSTGAEYQNTFAAALAPVLNFGVGIEYDPGEHTSWYASVITDNSGAETGSGTNFAVSRETTPAFLILDQCQTIHPVDNQASGRGGSPIFNPWMD